MNPDQNGSKSPGDGKSGRPTPGLFWYLTAAGFGVLMVCYWVGNANLAKIKYPQFVELIESGARDHQTGDVLNRRHSVLVPSQGRNKRQVFRYSNLRAIQIGDGLVSGTVDVQVGERSSDQPNKIHYPDEQAREGKVRAVIATSEIARDNLEKLLSKHGHRDWEAREASFLANYGPMLMMTGLLVLFFVFIMRRMGGAGSPMQFGRSRGKLFALEDLGITFDDVAGIDEAVEEVREIVDFLRSPEKYQRLGGRIPKGMLLVGPPGTGKTLLAKAIAGEAEVPFFSLSGSDFVEMFVGVGAARVRDMFQQAKSKSSCIIFIDELDALGKTRGNNLVGGHDEREQTLNALLVEMDGFNSNSGVIVVGATNRPEILDQALLRPGRFDRQVLVDRPDITGRQQILKVHVKDVKLDPDVALQDVAAITPGFVGADLANLVNEAALLAARQEKSTVEMSDFDEGVERVTAGLEKKRRVMSPDEKQRIAYHESGHALVALSLPNTDPVHKVSIIPRGVAALGYMMQRPEADRYLMTQSELESQIQILLAGTITEEIIFPDVSTGAQNDLERATEIARRMVMDFGMSRLGRVNYRVHQSSAHLANAGSENYSRTHSEQTAREIDEEVKRIVHDAMKHVHNILEVRRPALEAIAQRLIEIESINAEELKTLIDNHTTGPMVVPGTDARTASSTSPGEEETASAIDPLQADASQSS
ncbi:MAG: ATP-dependent zinc metalloprotease FtsH [Planctomycetaceae bacterium]|nr:ATP-dependent zinc metalloprotease FtsH [Planctomycetaceae bacterium]